MTNKEAIDMLRSKMDGKTDTSYEWCECVRMAIKALSEQESDIGNEGNRMGDICTDNRFEMIEKYRELLKQGTNIETSQEEMQVIDNILFRLWQMGWLDKIESAEVKYGEWIEREDELGMIDDLMCSLCSHCTYEDYPNFCSNCGANMSRAIPVEEKQNERR